MAEPRKENLAWKVQFYKKGEMTLRYGVYSSCDLSEVQHTIFFFPGRGEYLEKYSELPRRLKLAEKTALVILDHRGQGASGGHPFHVLSYDEFCEDIKGLMDSFLEANKSYSIIGYSMGGLIALYGIFKGYFQPKKLFLASPFLGLPKSLQWKIGAYGVSSFLHLAGFGKRRWKEYELGESFEGNQLTENPEHFEFLKNPIYPSEEGSFSWVRASFNAFFYVLHLSDVTKLPKNLVVCFARNELVVSNSAIFKFVKRAHEFSSCGSVSLLSFNSKHELFFAKEKERARFYKVLNEWTLS